MALTQVKLAAMSANSVDSDQYVDGSIDNAHLADDAVDSDEIAAGAIDTAHIADNQVNGDKLTDNIDIAGTLDVTSAAVFDSTITSVGNINTGGNPWTATANGGILYANGTTAFSGDQNTYGLWRGYTTGTNTVTSEIFANGSATFAADITGNGGFTGKRTNDAYHVFRGQNSSGTQTSLITGAGDISDSKGNVRKIPENAKTTSYTLVVGDAGKYIKFTPGDASQTLTVPDSVFAAGDAITIVNNSGNNLAIAKGTNMYYAADATNANRTLAGRGVATLLFTAADTCYITGAGLS